jgi:hypothetical protein
MSGITHHALACQAGGGGAPLSVQSKGEGLLTGNFPCNCCVPLTRTDYNTEHFSRDSISFSVTDYFDQKANSDSRWHFIANVELLRSVTEYEE